MSILEPIHFHLTAVQGREVVKVLLRSLGKLGFQVVDMFRKKFEVFQEVHYFIKPGEDRELALEGVLAEESFEY